MGTLMTRRPALKSFTLFLSAVALTTIAAVAGTLALAQGTAGQSNYIFRFNTGISSVFLSDMKFASEAPLNLGACTVTEKTNGPLSCVVNCSNDPVCLLEVSGPSGAKVGDVMEIAAETPLPSATPAPSASVSPAASPSPGTAGLFGWQSGSGREASAVRRRVEAYNGVSG